MSRPLGDLTLREAVTKARTVRLHELRVRGVQAAAALTERLGFSARTLIPSDRAFTAQALANARPATALLDDFRATCVFDGLQDRCATVAELRKRWPHAESDIVGIADQLIAGRFELLGRSVSFGDPIDWRLDPSTGKRTPLLHWTRVDPLRAESAGEYKLTWELNRHQHFVVLGQAYWLTGDDRYAAAIVRQLTDWAAANPPKLGINWASSLELSYRVIAWIWSLQYIRASERLTPGVFLHALKFLYLQGRHIETFLSTYYSPNTHLTGEALGLVYLGSFFPFFRCAGRWRRLGERILHDEIARQIRADGVHFEQATYYHRYTVDIYTQLKILTRAGASASEVTDRALTRLLDFLLNVMRPDGTTPLLGDDDGGRVLKLDRRAPNDFRAALANGAILYGSPEYRFTAQEAAEESLWLFGPRALEAFDRLAPQPPVATACGFADSGFYVARDGWHAQANYVLMDCGPHGTMNCGHAHADALSIELAVRGQPMVVDPGTFTYTVSREERDHFRASGAHSTVCIDGQSSSLPAGPFQWAHVARCSATSWLATERFAFFEGGHDGYQRLASPVLHTRALLFLKGEYWIVRDRVLSDGQHRVELCFQLAPLAAVRVDGQSADAALNGAELAFRSIARTGQYRVEDGAVSVSYGRKQQAARLVLETGGRGAQEIVTFLFPLAAGGTPPSVHELAASTGRAFRIVGPKWCDVILLGATAPGGTDGIESDFEWSWIRRSSEGDVPADAIGINGSRIVVGATAVVDSGAPVAFAMTASNARPPLPARR